MIGITKNFRSVVANHNVDFDLYPSEIHSILGENGAGKTTLMKILAGMHQPDAGTIIVRNRTVKIHSPQDSLRLGIGMVYQHFALIPNLTVIENLILGFEDSLFLNLRRAKQRLQEISATYGLSVEPQKKIQDLSVSERQRTEILKILFHESDVLILDEPASMLAPAETLKMIGLSSSEETQFLNIPRVNIKASAYSNKGPKFLKSFNCPGTFPKYP